ncbi:MAG: homoserine dehydrogenase [Terriglobia bacterium]
MNYQLLFKELGTRSIRLALSGANGDFGRSLLAQCRAIRNLVITALCDLDVLGTQSMLASLGFAGHAGRVCESEGEARQAQRDGKIAVVRNHSLLAALNLDILVEATGQPEVSLEMAARAIRRGVHVVMVSKETDSVAGPWLSSLAAEHKVSYTTTDGDQPGNLIGLISWARLLGLRIVAAGKSSEFDYVFDPATGNVVYRDIAYKAPELGSLWRLGSNAAGVMRRRSDVLGALPQRATPDFCEMNIVANATGLVPSCEALTFPICRVAELADVFIPRDEGGLLERTGVLDVFNCLRRDDEPSFAGGVFIVVECTDAPTWRLLREKGHLVSQSLKYACIYLPYHLMGIESPVTLFSAVLHNGSSAAPNQRVHAVMIARAQREFTPGEVLTMGGHHHEIDGMSPFLPPAAAASGNAPYYLAANKRLRSGISKGSDVMLGALDLEGSALSTAWQSALALGAGEHQR